MENHVVLRSKVLSRPGGYDYFQLDIQATFPLDPATGTIADKDSVTRHRLDCITRLVLDSVEDPATRKATSENPTPAPERRLNLASDLYHTHSRPLQPNITAPGIPLNLASDLDDIDSDLNPLQSNSTNDSCPGLSVANGTQRLTSASTGGEPEVEPTRKKRKRSPKPAGEPASDRLAQYMVSALLQAPRRFEQQSLLSWWDDLETLKPTRGCFTLAQQGSEYEQFIARNYKRLDQLAGSYEQYADAGYFRYRTTRLIGCLLEVALVESQRINKKKPKLSELDKLKKHQRERNRHLGELLLCLTRGLYKAYGKEAYKLCASLAASDHESFNPDWWIWKRLNKDEVRAVADEVVRMVIDAKDHSWSKIDSRHALDPAEVVTADDLPTLGLEALEPIDGSVASTVDSGFLLGLGGESHYGFRPADEPSRPWDQDFTYTWPSTNAACPIRLSSAVQAKAREAFQQNIDPEASLRALENLLLASPRPPGFYTSIWSSTGDMIHSSNADTSSQRLKCLLEATTRIATGLHHHARAWRMTLLYIVHEVECRKATESRHAGVKSITVALQSMAKETGFSTERIQDLRSRGIKYMIIAQAWGLGAVLALDDSKNRL
ncbi:hypothetical protein LTR02_015406 [Friedmanniomyces endolithicus]|nr:hypothetical protein LTR02_015406 [Friedmanniomyces endolithicus]